MLLGLERLFFFACFPAAVLTNLLGGNHARGGGKMRLLKSKGEKIRLFDRAENEAQLGKSYGVGNDNGEKRSISLSLLSDIHKDHAPGLGGGEKPTLGIGFYLLPKAEPAAAPVKKAREAQSLGAGHHQL